MVERQPADAHVRWLHVQTVRSADSGDVRVQIGVRQHDALRCRRRSRGELQEGRLVERGVRWSFERRAAEDRVDDEHTRGRIEIAQVQEGGDLDGREDSRGAAGGQQLSCLAGKGRHVASLGRRDQGHGKKTGRADGEECGDEAAHFGRDERHAVVRHQPLGEKRAAHEQGVRKQLGVGNRSRSAVVLDGDDAVRCPAAATSAAETVCFGITTAPRARRPAAGPRLQSRRRCECGSTSSTARRC